MLGKKWRHSTDEDALVLRLNVKANFPEQTERRVQDEPLIGYIAIRSLPDGQFRVPCESVPRQILLVVLLVIPGAARGTRVLQFDKRSEVYHTSFNHQRSTKSPIQTQKCMQTKWRDEMAQIWKHIFRYGHFRAKYRYVGVFFERRFQPLSIEGLFSSQWESISRCPKSIIPSKTQNRQIAWTSPLMSKFTRHERICLFTPRHDYCFAKKPSDCRTKTLFVFPNLCFGFLVFGLLHSF